MRRPARLRGYAALIAAWIVIPSCDRGDESYGGGEVLPPNASAHVPPSEGAAPASEGAGLGRASVSAGAPGAEAPGAGAPPRVENRPPGTGVEPKDPGPKGGPDPSSSGGSRRTGAHVLPIRRPPGPSKVDLRINADESMLLIEGAVADELYQRLSVPEDDGVKVGRHITCNRRRRTPKCYLGLVEASSVPPIRLSGEVTGDPGP